MTPLCRYVLGLVSVASPLVAAPGPCPEAGAPAKIDFEILDPELVRSHQYSANDIMDVSQKRSGIINIGKSGRTMGLTTYKPSFRLGGRPAATPVAGGVCVSLAEVQVGYGFEYHEVLVAKEFPVGSCEYQVVLDHEDTHVKFNRDTLKEYSAKVRAELDAMLAKPAVVKTTDANAALQKALGDVYAKLTPLLQEAQKVQRERNASIDTSFSYGEAFKKCGNWDQGNIFLDGLSKKPDGEKKPESNAIATPPKPSGDPFGLGKMPTRRD